MLFDRSWAPYLKNKNGHGMKRKEMHPIKVLAQFTPSYEVFVSFLFDPTNKKILTFVNSCTVNKGNTAATADRTMVFAANADELYMRYMSTR